MGLASKSALVRSVVVVVVALLVLGLALVVWVWKNPLALYERTTRKALAEAGLERSERAGPAGRLVVWQGGRGPRLVLLHGAGDQAGAWAPVAASLVHDYTLLIPDLPGHGESEPQAGPLRMEEIFSGLAALLDSQGSPAESPPTLVGNSMGAWLAMVYAHRFPRRVERVVAVNGGPLSNDLGGLSLVPRDRGEARKLMAALRDPASPAVPDFVLDDIVDRAAAGPIGRLMQDLEGMQGFLLDGRLGEITVPVEVVWGESDRLMKLDYARRMVEQLPRARLTIVSRCGHVPQNECPAAFGEILGSILRAEPPPPKAEPEPQPAASEGESEAGDDSG